MGQDARRFIFSSDSETPNFIYKKEGSTTNTGQFVGGCVKFAHGLSFVPLVVGYWSLNADFSNAHDITVGAGQEYGSGLMIRADSQYIYITTSVEDSTSHTFYYRLFAYAPPDYDGEVTPISDSSKFHFDTDYTYLQIAKAGKVIPGANRQVEVQHNLGYLPIYKIWRTSTMNFVDNNTPVVIKGLGPIAAVVDYSNTYSIQNVSDLEKLTITWEDYAPSGDDYAYYHIYSNEA